MAVRKNVKIEKEMEVWEAADGKQFETELACQKYESGEMKEAMTKRFNEYLKDELDVCDTNEVSLYFIRFETEQDFDDFKMCAEHEDAVYGFDCEKPSLFPVNRIVYWDPNEGMGFMSEHCKLNGQYILESYISRMALTVCKMQAILDRLNGDEYGNPYTAKEE